jgi:trans-2,3-dihydro-3-hydroxyanthranilate isomerase
VADTLWAETPETDKQRSYLIADVFTGTPLEGNPLGVFLDARGMTTELMQRTAKELNLSETVFFLPAEQDGADVKVRIFTPARELPFAGHPTLGSGFVMAGRLGKKNITLEEGIGLVPLTFQDDGYGQMEQRVPVAEPYEYEKELLDALRLEKSELPVEAYRNGPRHVYVALPDMAAVASLRPDMGKLTEHEVGVSCFAGDGATWKTRVFVPLLGVKEDPATGSAAGPLGVHLARHGQIGFGQRIEVSQGKEIARPSTLYVTVEGTRDHIEHVYVGGRAVIVASGQYRLS